MSFLLLAALSCAPVRMENRTKYPWNNRDMAVLMEAQQNCKKHYPSLPCVAQFVKLHEQGWGVTCDMPLNPLRQYSRRYYEST